MSSLRVKAACSLCNLVLQPCDGEESDGDPAMQVFSDAKAASLLRQRLERRSDRTFVLKLHSALLKEGVPAGQTTGCLKAVINSPTVYLSRTASAPKRTEILQAALVRQSDDDASETLLTVLRAAVDTAKPPAVMDASVEAIPIDITAVEDQCALAEYLEDWWREFGVHEVTLPPSASPRTLVWLGNPAAGGYRDTPGDWQARVRTIGSVLGMRVLIAASSSQARAQALHERGDLLIRLHGGRNWEEVEERVRAEGKPLLVAGAVGTSFEDLLRSARKLLVPRVLEPIGTDAIEPRELAPGETVYHRKIGVSIRYDHFDAGSPRPCVHGEESFEPWRHTDKAAKGMARRYTNFGQRDVQLLHCDRYPACNMYAVSRRAERT